jgi:catechol 2,3-dioxygenase-like lactoylglutathione lyase family enzyme
MKYISTLLAVKDIKKSRQFYEEIFHEEVKFDFGRNIVFKSGICLQQDFALLADISPESIVERSHNMELYYEASDFESELNRLAEYQSIKYVHPLKIHAWKQQVIRIYDPDYHIIEIGEAMESVAKKYLQKGYSIEETAKIIQHPIAFVKSVELGKK